MAKRSRPGADLREVDIELPDRRAYEERLAIEAERARRYRYPLALVLIKLDGLDAVAEQGGEPAVEDVLREVAEVLGGSRFADEAFRIGDGEFAILLPHTDLAGAEAAAARMTMQVLASGLVGASWGAASDEGHPGALHERAAQVLTAGGGADRSG
jgi:diguanylate cyclase (GGDEF)-like protein